MWGFNNNNEVEGQDQGQGQQGQGGQPSIEQLEQNLKTGGQGGETTNQPQHQTSQGQPQQISVTLPNGQQFTGTQEEINEQYQRLMQQAQSQQQAGGSPNFSVEEWGRKLESDPLEGMNYLDKARFGFDPKQAMVNMAGVITKLQDELREIQFSQNEELRDPRARQTVEQYVQSGRAQNMNDALLLAKAEGKIKPVEAQGQGGQGGQQNNDRHPWEQGQNQPSYGPQAPPSMGQGTSQPSTGGNFTEEQIREMTKDLDLPQIEQLIHRMS